MSKNCYLISKTIVTSYVKIEQINQQIKLPPNAILVTWDVKSLCTNIPHEDGLDALKLTLENNQVPKHKIETILEFSKLVLNSNHFKFLGKHYLQKSGTAMGTKMTPSYPNLFMGVLGDRMINSYAYKALVYLRYIDDIFMIWTEGEENLNGFLSHCNQINKNIQFEKVASKEKVPFLDVSVINEIGKLHTDLHSKPTDKYQYLYSHSCHPKHTKNSLPYCLALRLRRICSKKTYFNQCAKEMEHHLLQRSYIKGCIRDAINKASSISRGDALVDKTNDNQLTRVPFVVTYNPKLPSLPKILKESRSILHVSERCVTVFPEVPLVSYRRSRNLSDIAM